MRCGEVEHGIAEQADVRERGAAGAGGERGAPGADGPRDDLGGGGRSDDHGRARGAGGLLRVREHGDKRDWDPRELAGRLEAEDVQLTLVAVTQPAGDLLGQELLAAGYTGVVIGIGASVAFVVGARRRAPGWVQWLGLEWFFRFLLEPKRLWRRYFVEGIPTYLKVIRPMTAGRVLE